MKIADITHIYTLIRAMLACTWISTALGCCWRERPRRKRPSRLSDEPTRRRGRRLSWQRYYEFRKRYCSKFAGKGRWCLPFPVAVEKCLSELPGRQAICLYDWNFVCQEDLEASLRMLADRLSNESAFEIRFSKRYRVCSSGITQVMPLASPPCVDETPKRNTNVRVTVESDTWDLASHLHLLHLVGRYFSKVTWWGEDDWPHGRLLSTRSAREDLVGVDEVHVGPDVHDLSCLNLFASLRGISQHVTSMVNPYVWNQIVRFPCVTRLTLRCGPWYWSWHQRLGTHLTLPNRSVREVTLCLPDNWGYFLCDEQLRRLCVVLQFLREYVPGLEQFRLQSNTTFLPSVIEGTVSQFRALAFPRLVSLDIGKLKVVGELGRFDPLFRGGFRVRRRISLLSWRRCVVAHSRPALK